MRILTRFIMVSTALFSFLSAYAQTPDLIYYNATIVTMEDSLPSAEAIAIANDSILAVGSNDAVLSLVGAETKIVDLQGLTVTPGFNDSHCHWFSWREHICSVTGDTTYPSLEEIMGMLSANGWTSISELNFGRPDYAPEHLNNALDLDARGALSVRVNGYWGTYDDVSLIQVLADSMRTPGKVYSERVRATGVKIYVDNPFGDFDILTQEQVNQLVRSAHDAGWQIAAHAVNQSAVEKILTAYENVLGAESNENYRYRIEHAVKVSDDQLNRMKQKGIIASFQLMGPADWPSQPTYAARFLGTHPEWVMRWKDFVAAESGGLRTCGSTDAPFNDTPCDYTPFRVMYQAVTRLGFHDFAHADWELAQRLTVKDCLKLLTINGAYATFEENKKGSLAPGKWADLVILSANPLEVSQPEDLLNIKVLLTMVGGRVEYCDASQSNLCSSAEIFSINSADLTASKYLSEQTPDLAYDNDLDTSWGAGDSPPQWIQIDLLDEFQITGLDLLIDQWPEGQTVHQLWAKGNAPGQTFVLLHEFRGNTAYGQTLSYVAPPDLPPYRYFKILTTDSPSWVAWKEISIHRPNTTSVHTDDPSVPGTFALLPNYPNPFNPGTTIEYSITKKQQVELNVYDIRGRQVAQLVNQLQSPGIYRILFRARDLADGLYFYRLKTTEGTKIRKMVVVK